MSGSAAKASRRQIRRSLGPEGLAVVSRHEDFLTHQVRGNQQMVRTLDGLIAQVTALEAQVAALEAARTEHTRRLADLAQRDEVGTANAAPLLYLHHYSSVWQRLRWLIGR